MADNGLLSRALGGFGLGLGLAALGVPRPLAQLIGVQDSDEAVAVLRAIGLREITSGVAILTQNRPIVWLWARVGGDAMDLALLTSELDSKRTRYNRVVMALGAVASITALDLLCSMQLSRRSKEGLGGPRKDGAVEVHNTITINRPPEEVYNFWHDFRNLPRFMTHLEAVQVTGPGRSHWKTLALAGTSVEWDAEVTEDVPNQLIAWHSFQEADVDNAGSVRFDRAPDGKGTVVRVALRYDPPDSKIGATIFKLLGDAPAQQVQGDLRSFKQVMETGEIVRSDANLGGAGMKQRSAQPAPNDRGK